MSRRIILLSLFVTALAGGESPIGWDSLEAQAAVDGRRVVVEDSAGRMVLDQAAYYNGQMERKEFFWFLLEEGQIPLAFDRLQRVELTGPLEAAPGGYRPAEAVLEGGRRISGALLTGGALFGIGEESRELLRYSPAYEPKLILTFPKPEE